MSLKRPAPTYENNNNNDDVEEDNLMADEPDKKRPALSKDIGNLIDAAALSEEYIKVNSISNVNLDQFNFSNTVTLGDYFCQDQMSGEYVKVHPDLTLLKPQRPPLQPERKEGGAMSRKLLLFQKKNLELERERREKEKAATVAPEVKEEISAVEMTEESYKTNNIEEQSRKPSPSPSPPPPHVVSVSPDRGRSITPQPVPVIPSSIVSPAVIPPSSVTVTSSKEQVITGYRVPSLSPSLSFSISLCIYIYLSLSPSLSLSLSLSLCLITAHFCLSILTTAGGICVCVSMYIATVGPRFTGMLGGKGFAR
eukprot:sb/3467101/